MSGPAIWSMLLDLQHADLSPDDRQILAPAFNRLHAGEVVALPEVIIGHVRRLHEYHCH